MTSTNPDHEIEPEVQLLNVDLELSGAFDHASLLRSLGDSVFVVAADAGSLLSLEVNDVPDSTLMDKISQFVALVRALPPDARGVWNSATRRVFNIGIQSGLTPHCTEWTLPTELLAALVEIGAEVTITLYGAEYEVSRAAD